MRHPSTRKKSSLIRFGIVRIIDGEPTLIGGNDTPGPITFYSLAEALAHIRYANITDIKVVKVRLSYTT